MKLKKIISLLLCFSIILSSIGFAFADEVIEEEVFDEFEFDTTIVEEYEEEVIDTATEDVEYDTEYDKRVAAFGGVNIKYGDWPHTIPGDLPADITFDPVRKSKSLTQYTPWFDIWHLRALPEIERGEWGAESGQVVLAASVSPVNNDYMYYSTDTSGIYYSRDGGRNWYVSGEGLYAIYTHDILAHPTELETVFCTQLGTVEGQWSGIFVSYNGGKQWQLLKYELMGNDRNRKLRFDANNNLYAAPDRGVILKSPDYGKTWEEFDATPTDDESFDIKTNPLTGLWVSEDGMCITAFFKNYGMMVSEDGGLTWELRNPQKNDMHEYRGTPTDLAANPLNKEHWFAAFSGDPDYKGMYESFDRGRTWRFITGTQANVKNSSSLANIYFSPIREDGTVRMFASYNYLNKTIRYSDDLGKSWYLPKEPGEYDNFCSTNTYQDSIILIRPDDWRQVYHFNTNCVRRSEDGGNSFVDDVSGSSGVYLRNCYVDRQGRWYAICVDKGCYRTIEPLKADENGEMPGFERVFDHGQVYEILQAHDSDEHFYILESKRIYETTDDFETVRPVTPQGEKDYQLLQYHKDDPNVIYGCDFTSYDGGKSWSRNPYSTRGVNPVNNDMLVAMKDYSIYLSYDRGKTWELFRDFRNDLPTTRRETFIHMGVSFDYADPEGDKFWFSTQMGWVIEVDGDNWRFLPGLGYYRCTAPQQDPNNPDHLLIGGTKYSQDDRAPYRKNNSILESWDRGNSWAPVMGMPGMRGSTLIYYNPLEPGKAYIGTMAGTNVYYYDKYFAFKSKNDGIYASDDMAVTSKDNAVIYTGNYDLTEMKTTFGKRTYTKAELVFDGRFNAGGYFTVTVSDSEGNVLKTMKTPVNSVSSSNKKIKMELPFELVDGNSNLKIEASYNTTVKDASAITDSVIEFSSSMFKGPYIYLQ